MSQKTKFIECELRGPITWNDFMVLRSRVEEKWGGMTRVVELTMFAKGRHDFRLKINKYGVHLILKYKAKKGEAKFEREIDINPKHLASLIDILHNIGETKWVLSCVDKFETRKGPSSISFKFGSRIGDFFEIEELVSDKKEIPEAISRIKKIAAEFGLQLWDKRIFEKISNQSWDGVRSEPLIKNQILHPLIIKALTANDFLFAFNESETIAERLRNKSNDFSHLEDIFTKATGLELLSNKPLNSSQTFFDKISIIIPSYNSAQTLAHTLRSIQYQKLSKKEKSLVEVIVVDDGSTDNMESIVNKFNKIMPIKYVRQNHLGRAHARNLGASLAQGDIIIFLDSDVVLENHFIREHAIRHVYLNEAAFVSFKENIQLSDKRLSRRIFKPNIVNDFRFKKEVKSEWLRMHRHVRNIEIRKVELLRETDNFKNFGQDKVLGVWDLPSIFVTNAVSIKKKDFNNVGGFNPQFKGWGMEDTFLGACLITLNRFIVPVFSTGIFHIEHNPRSGSNKRMIKEFNKNVLVYLDLIHQPISSIFKKSDS
ncbi:MAG: glycosyltransferase family 2 protein [Patescibacteria group bacterium]